MMINNITIVGGGSAGYMTAATLLNQFPNKKITLVESPNISTIGVGESTVGGNQSGFAGITNWLSLVDIDVQEFMPHTDAIFKLTIAFENFYRKNSGTFHLPFGPGRFLPDVESPEEQLAFWYAKRIFHPEKPIDYTEWFYPAMALVNQNKSPFTKNFSPNIDPQISGRLDLEKDELNNEVLLNSEYSLQFDATKFGLWLRDNYCKTRYPNNFTHILAEVEDIPLNEDGIEHLILDNGQKLEADLFVDCTGFKSLLLSKTFNVPFVSIEDYIPNNHAWATKIPYKDPETQIVNYTRCTAIENGWIWEIPLWSRMGSGYVFSDKFISSEEALKEFKRGLIKKGYEKVEDLEYHLIPMKCGIQSNLWVKNTCAIGLAAGFIEPLQSTGLQSIHQFIFNLTRTLSRDHISEWDRKAFTAKCQDDFYGFASAVAILYTLSHRDDTEYWRDIQNKDYPADLFSHNPEGISKWLANYYADKNVNFHFENDNFGKNVQLNSITTGMNWNPIDLPSIKYNGGTIEILKKRTEIKIQQIEERRRRWNEQIKDLPSPYQYLKDHIHKGKYE